LKRAILNTDWLMGVAFCAAFALAAFGTRLFYGLETAVYDRYMQLSYRQPASDIAVIAIDDRSIDSIGRWPWTRDILASVIDQLHAGGARLVASTVFMSEPEIDAGLDSLREIDAYYRGSALSRGALGDAPLPRTSQRSAHDSNARSRTSTTTRDSRRVSRRPATSSSPSTSHSVARSVPRPTRSRPGSSRRRSRSRRTVTHRRSTRAASSRRSPSSASARSASGI
jgi:CHASE2 domain-containing sensor protein